MCRVIHKRHGEFFSVKHFVDMMRAPFGVFVNQATKEIYDKFSVHWQRHRQPIGQLIIVTVFRYHRVNNLLL